MKKVFLISLVMAAFGANAQTTVSFSYDNEGNQTLREICLTCRKAVSTDSIKTLETLTESDLIKDEQFANVSYYPNPVREELYLKWTMNNDEFITQATLFTMTGQQIFEYQNLSNREGVTIGFQSQPQGFYNLVLYYNTGKKKVLKILKK